MLFLTFAVGSHIYQQRDQDSICKIKTKTKTVARRLQNTRQ